jgi:hypothetical protein
MGFELLYTSLLFFVLASAIMYLIPERLFTKKFYNEAGLSKAEVDKHRAKPGFYRKVFLVSGSIIILLMLFVRYVIL